MAAGEAPLTLGAMREAGKIEYIPFPEGLKERYQSHTEADLGNLRKSGYADPFLRVEEGVSRYVDWMLERDGPASRKSE